MQNCNRTKHGGGGSSIGGGGKEGRRRGRREDGRARRGTFPGLTLGVFLPAVAVLLLIVGQFSLLVCLVLAHVAVIPVVVR